MATAQAFTPAMGTLWGIADPQDYQFSENPAERGMYRDAVRARDTAFADKYGITNYNPALSAPVGNLVPGGVARGAELDELIQRWATNTDPTLPTMNITPEQRATLMQELANNPGADYKQFLTPEQQQVAQMYETFYGQSSGFDGFQKALMAGMIGGFGGLATGGFSTVGAGEAVAGAGGGSAVAGGAAEAAPAFAGGAGGGGAVAGGAAGGATVAEGGSFLSGLLSSLGLDANSGIGKALTSVLMPTGEGDPLSSALSLGSGLYGLYLSDRTRDDAKAAAARMDPFGGERARYAEMLRKLYEDPSQVERLPGYKAGLDAVERKMASQGYLGSGNMMLALHDYGGRAFDAEAERLATLAGAKFAPSGGNLVVSGNQNANDLASQSIASLGYGAKDLWKLFQ